MPTTLEIMRESLSDLVARRGNPGGGFEPARFLELHGASIIEPTAFEPDPRSHHSDYYYNAVTNRIHKRVVSKQPNGVITAAWIGIN